MNRLKNSNGRSVKRAARKLRIGAVDITQIALAAGPEDLDDVELLLNLNTNYPAIKALKEDFLRDGIPYTAFEVEDI